ncbi:hypothetical protein JMJ35_000694 [Cladonia borealis]|uniref:F-box domain-containing protein n=1 Tax=Cladonia borealis TaxID=184061 RepID=A0AA39RBH9_9LECA|nr:hypothetical protein JMJ35_000694 [Cladonia borealis]
MENETAFNQQLESIRNEFIVNGFDLFADFGFDDDTLDSSVFASPYIDSSSDDDTVPVRFMQTDIQKRRHRQNLEKRRLLQAIRRLKRARREKPQKITLPSGRARKVWRAGMQVRKRQMKDPFKALPCDVLLDIMRQTRCGDFGNLMEVSPAAEDLYSGNESACIRGIEVEQYSQLKWLFGDSRQRTTEQKQALKDWIGTYYYASEDEDTVVEDFGRIDDGKLTGPRSLKYPRWVQMSLGDVIKFLQGTTGIEVTCRTALCMQALTVKRAELVETTLVNRARGHQKTQLVRLSEMPSEDRIRLFKRQPATTQNEICRIFEEIISPIAKVTMDRSVASWVRHYYSEWAADDPSKDFEEMGTWLTSLSVGMVMQVVLEHPGETMDTWMDMCTGRIGSSNMWSIILLELEMEGQGEEQVKTGMEFAEVIGFDARKVLAGTPVEETLDELLEEDTLDEFLEEEILNELYQEEIEGLEGGDEESIFGIFDNP